MRHFQKIIFIIAVLTLSYSIWYYSQLNSPEPSPPAAIISPITEDPIVSEVKPFDVSDYGVTGEEAVRLNEYFHDVQDEVTGIIARDETVVIRMAQFKTNEDYKRILYMALSMIDRIKVVSQRACDRLQEKLSEATNPDQKQVIKQSQEYVVCFPGKW